MQYFNIIYIIWAQNSNSTIRFFILLKKCLPLVYSLRLLTHTSHLFKECSILKLSNKIAHKNSLFIIFKNWLTLSSDSHAYNIPWSNLRGLVVPTHTTNLFSTVNISA